MTENPTVDRLLAKIEQADCTEDAIPLVDRAAELSLRQVVSVAANDEEKPVSETFIVPAPNAKAKSMIVAAVASSYNVRVLGEARLVHGSYKLNLVGFPSDTATVKRLSTAIMRFAESEAERNRKEHPEIHGKSYKQRWFNEFGVRLTERLTETRQNTLAKMRPKRAMTWASREAAVQEKMDELFGRRKPKNGTNGDGPLLSKATLAEIMAEIDKRINQ